MQWKEEILSRINMQGFQDKVEERRMRFTGYILSMSDDKNSKRALKWAP